MEDVLGLCAEPYDPQRPVVCFDESSTQLLAETREPVPARPGRPRREDYEYVRAGTRNLFLACEPKAGWRHVAITQRRTMEDFAQQMRWLVDEAYPDVPVVRLALDNLNTHRVASLYKAFPPAEARRIAKRLEFHYTPKHGSWLNMAGMEFSVLARACLRRRNPDEESLEWAVNANVSQRNAASAPFNWRFTARDARRKLHRLYPCHSLFDVIPDPLCRGRWERCSSNIRVQSHDRCALLGLVDRQEALAGSVVGGGSSCTQHDVDPFPVPAIVLVFRVNLLFPPVRRTPWGACPLGRRRSIRKS